MGIAREARRVWSASVHDIGDFQSRVVLTAFYFTVFVPFAVLTRLFSDPLRLRHRAPGTDWQAWVNRDSDVNAARRQY